jgi:serine/threonine protein kinase
LPEGAAADPELRRRFEQEALAVAALSHPNIVALHDVGTHDGASDAAAYMFYNADSTFPPFDRSPMTGFRCIKPVAADPADAVLDDPVPRKVTRNWEKEPGFSEDA